jgi:hypothetical protein
MLVFPTENLCNLNYPMRTFELPDAYIWITFMNDTQLQSPYPNPLSVYSTELLPYQYSIEMNKDYFNINTDNIISTEIRPDLI